jgi:AP-3 complex subunit delta-1
MMIRSSNQVLTKCSVTYVALLAFNKIVVTHPFFVSQQEDVILECIDSPDITIRIKALDLVQGMVSQENLVSIVSRLMKQLKVASQNYEEGPNAPSQDHADVDEEPIQERPAPKKELVLPEDYQVDVIGRILRMCSQNNYNSVVDFDWYIDVLTQLVRVAPAPRRTEMGHTTALKATSSDITEKIGDELRNVAVKVKAMRGSAVRAADSIVAQALIDSPIGFSISTGALKSIAWILGEYATSLASPELTLNSILQITPRTTVPAILMTCIQAATKIFSLISRDSTRHWTAERKSQISLLMARIIHTFEPLVLHPSLEVQERAVEFVELLKLTAEAASGLPASTDTEYQDPPLLLTQAIPSLFTGWELNSVAVGAQHNVPVPTELDLDQPIHPNLETLLSHSNMPFLESEEADEFDVYYNQRPAPTSISSETISMPAISRLGVADIPAEELSSSYQHSEESYLDADIIARRKADRVERHRDDPFYIGDTTAPSSSTPIHNILQSSNGPDLDIDSIPIMQLDIEKLTSSQATQQTFQSNTSFPRHHQVQQMPRARVAIAADETLTGSGASTPRYDSENSDRPRPASTKSKSSLLQVSSLGIGSLNLDGASSAGPSTADDEEMAKAMKEVERLRLEMQRASERVHVPQGVDTVIKTKKKKKVAGDADADGKTIVKKKKKKVIKAEEDGDGEGLAVGAGAVDEVGEASVGVVAAVPKKKKKKRVIELAE